MPSNGKKALRTRLVLLLALLAIVAVTLAGPQGPAASATCPDAARVNYYSDATYTTLVGYCVHGCCQLWSCYGTLTNYSKVVYEFSCSTQ